MPEEICRKRTAQVKIRHRKDTFYQIARETGDRRSEGNALWNMALALGQLEDRAQAMIHAEAALAIYEQIESPHADMVRNRLAEWKASDGADQR